MPSIFYQILRGRANFYIKNPHVWIYLLDTSRGLGVTLGGTSGGISYICFLLHPMQIFTSGGTQICIGWDFYVFCRSIFYIGWHFFTSCGTFLHRVALFYIGCVFLHQVFHSAVDNIDEQQRSTTLTNDNTQRQRLTTTMTIKPTTTIIDDIHNR